MKLCYTLTNADFLAYQLYVSSRSVSQRRTRKRARITSLIFFPLIGLYFSYTNGNPNGLIGSVICGVIYYFTIPYYLKWRYRRHFQKHLNENFKSKIDVTAALTLNAKSIHASDHAAESTIKASEVKELIELPAHFLIKLSTDDCLVIPKAAVQHQISFTNKLRSYGAKYVDELNWKWK